MKCNKGVYHLVLMLGMSMLLTACPSKSGGGGSSAAVDSTTSQFIQEYNSRVGGSSTQANRYNPFVIRSDGSIEYFHEVNRYCRFRWGGNIEKVISRDRSYSVTYSYNYSNVIDEGDYCDTQYQGWYYCEEKVRACRNYFYSRSKGSKTEVVRRGNGLDNLILRP